MAVTRKPRVTKSEKRTLKRRSPRGSQLTPLRSVRLLRDSGAVELAPREITNGNVGVKGYGLASMPAEWVPRFFVIDALFVDSRASDVEERIRDEVVRCGLSPSNKVIVRSNGNTETMSKRGQLVSQRCV